MADGNRIARAALAFNGHGDRARCQGTYVRRRESRAPCTIRQYRRRIGFAVYGHGQRRACAQAIAGTGNNQVLSVLDAVDHVVTRHGIHAQARQAGVYRDLTLAAAAVAHAVRHAGGYSQIAVAQRRQDRFRYIDGPGQIALHRCGVAVAANRYGHGVARLGIHHLTANGLAGSQLRRVNHVVTRDGVDNHPRQNGLHVYGVRGAGAVADAVRCGGSDGVKRFTQLTYFARRNGRGPFAVGLNRGAVGFAVEHHGHHRARRQSGSRTGDGQILRFLAAVDHIVTGDGVDGQHWRAQVDFHLARRAVAVSGFVGQRRGDGVIPGGQGTDVRRRHAHAPVAGRIQRRRVIFVIDGDGHHVARRRAGH